MSSGSTKHEELSKIVTDSQIIQIKKKEVVGIMKRKTTKNQKENMEDCDCLRNLCPGCFFPCENCNSTKCGYECRVGRNWTYEKLVLEIPK